MPSSLLSKHSESGRRPSRLVLSFGLPAVLLMAFLATQVLDFDRIGWSNGFSHPLLGWDHLVTMLAVGIWAAQLRGRAIWMLPLAFVGVMSVGGLAGAAGLAIPSVEGIILLSCAVFSILITRKVRFSTSINVLIVAFFAFFHGFAHGQEISTSASLISYTLGFMLATLLLHGAGILVAKLVVLGITCLLTMMFSNAALAKTAESLLENTLNDQAAVAQSDWSTLHSQQIDAVTRLSSSGGDHSFVPISPQSLANISQSTSPKIKLASAGDAGPVQQDSFPILSHWLTVWPLQADYLNVSRLTFRRYFPAINHTPGIHLLSSGVGLTSPPLLLILALALHVFTPLRKTPLLFLEDFSLQLQFARFDSGNLSRLTNNTPQQNHAIFAPCTRLPRADLLAFSADCRLLPTRLNTPNSLTLRKFQSLTNCHASTLAYSPALPTFNPLNTQ